MKLDRWQWAGVVGLGVIVLWVWGQYQADTSDPAWTDPGQPPPMLAPIVGCVGGRPQRMQPYSRAYPGSLAAWDGCCIGDV